jgi:hypothetical protein
MIYMPLLRLILSKCLAAHWELEKASFILLIAMDLRALELSESSVDLLKKVSGTLLLLLRREAGEWLEFGLSSNKQHQVNLPMRESA